MQLVLVNRTSGLSTNWKPVTPGDVPVEWLSLERNGGIHIRGMNTWQQQDPILTNCLHDWTYGKRPGSGQALVLKHVSGVWFHFKYDSTAEGWFYRRSVVSTSCTGRTARWSAPDSSPQSKSVKSTRDNKKPCTIATPLFSNEWVTQVSYDGLDGFTFFADGRLNYRDKTFGPYQAIAGYDDGRVTINRPFGRGKILEISIRGSQYKYRFSFHGTVMEDQRWYRWSVCEAPSVLARLKSAWQHAVRRSFLVCRSLRVLLFPFSILYLFLPFAVFWAFVCTIMVCPILAPLFFLLPSSLFDSQLKSNITRDQTVRDS